MPTLTPVQVATSLREEAARLEQLADLLAPLPDEHGIVVPDRRRDSTATAGVQLVAAERVRQQQDEGYDRAHDQGWPGAELAWRAFCYLERAAQRKLPQGDPAVPAVWPGKRGEWKPKDSRVRNYVIAAALIVAEVDRLIDRGEA